MGRSDTVCPGGTVLTRVTSTWVPADDRVVLTAALRPPSVPSRFVIAPTRPPGRWPSLGPKGDAPADAETNPIRPCWTMTWVSATGGGALLASVNVNGTGGATGAAAS